MTGAVFSTLLWHALRKVTARPFRFQVQLAILFVALAAVPFQLIVTFATAALLPGAAAWKAPCATTIAAGTIFWLAPLGVWAAMMLALFHEAASRQRQHRLAASRAEAQEAQLRALRYQVNPHFLYNTLNSISTLVLEGQTERADEMIMRLSHFFRTTLEGSETSDVSLAEELAFQRRYLEIEALRFTDRLKIDFEVPEEVVHARVPSLILQPLVENAIKHGMCEEGRQTWLRLSAACAGDRLVVQVSDNGSGARTSAGTGTGLANVRRRLAGRFGAAACLETRASGDGFTARIEMPLTV
jgi:LytS/YehU family sensor histidine kinase